MTKKLLGVFTTIVAALAVVGVAWASGDDGPPTSVTGVTTASASVSSDVPTPSTDVTVADSSTSTSVNSSTSTSVDDNGGDRDGGDRDGDRDDDDSPTTSTSIASPTSTSVEGTTSTSIDDDDDDDDDDDESTTSTSIDDNDRVVVPDGMTTHTIPGVGIVTIEAFAGELSLTAVSAPGWNVEREKIDKDRIELEFTNGLDAEADFEAKINDGRIEVRIEVDSD